MVSRFALVGLVVVIVALAERFPTANSLKYGKLRRLKRQAVFQCDALGRVQCPAGWLRGGADNQRCYLPRTDQVSWTAAQASCNSLGATLATVTLARNGIEIARPSVLLGGGLLASSWIGASVDNRGQTTAGNALAPNCAQVRPVAARALFALSQCDSSAGFVCEIDLRSVDGCAVCNPACANGGQCKSTNGLVECSCPFGFRGPLCQEAVPSDLPDVPADRLTTPPPTAPPQSPRTNRQSVNVAAGGGVVRGAAQSSAERASQVAHRQAADQSDSSQSRSSSSSSSD